MGNTKLNFCFETSLVTDLTQRGFSILQVATDDVSMASVLTSVARSLGMAINGRRTVIEEVKPVDQSNAKPRSLSARYGLEEFPWHMDTAHWSMPARFFLLGCINPGQGTTCTRLIDWRAAVCQTEIDLEGNPGRFIVKNGRNSFYASLYDAKNGFLRHDPGCMLPLDSESTNLQKSICELHGPANEVLIEWAVGQLLVVDNWRFLHRRDAALHSQDRRLLRCYVEKDSQW